ncbi:MAG TPA: quinone oxidoreductase [Thermoanaerobaculia bacterium]|jgi:NADPH2:quinone reductase|nr:quinone oxidoreductase [Thermoanaerobaculia bacterium]
MKAIRIHQNGGPEAMRLEELPDPTPVKGEALVAVEAAGVNFIDVYNRTGLYKTPLPYTLGQEGAGTVLATGEGVTGVRKGERVAWYGTFGAYATRIVAPAQRLVPVPDGVTSKQAAAVMLQGMTAHYLARSTYVLKPGDTCIVHAAAGGVGLLLTQIATLVGAAVLGTAGSAEKVRLAREAGAVRVVDYTKEDFLAAAKELTDGRGVQVVYDSVGRTTFDKSLASLAPRGMLVTFGQSSGPVPPFDPLRLSQGGSLYLTRPTLGHYSATREELMWRANEVLGWVRDGTLRVRIDREVPLADAAAAHRALEARETAGKVLLIP